MRVPTKFLYTTPPGRGKGKPATGGRKSKWFIASVKSFHNWGRTGKVYQVYYVIPFSKGKSIRDCRDLFFRGTKKKAQSDRKRKYFEKKWFKMFIIHSMKKSSRLSQHRPISPSHRNFRASKYIYCDADWIFFPRVNFKLKITAGLSMVFTLRREKETPKLDKLWLMPKFFKSVGPTTINKERSFRVKIWNATKSTIFFLLRNPLNYVLLECNKR